MEGEKFRILAADLLWRQDYRWRGCRRRGVAQRVERPANGHNHDQRTEGHGAAVRFQRRRPYRLQWGRNVGCSVAIENDAGRGDLDRKSTPLNSSHLVSSYAV